MTGQPFVHPGPAKDPDAITSFVGAIRALVKVKAERDAAEREVFEQEAEIERLKAEIAALRRGRITAQPRTWASGQVTPDDLDPGGTVTPPADSVPPTGLTEASP